MYNQKGIKSLAFKINLKSLYKFHFDSKGNILNCHVD